MYWLQVKFCCLMNVCMALFWYPEICVSNGDGQPGARAVRFCISIDVWGSRDTQTGRAQHPEAYPKLSLGEGAGRDSAYGRFALGQRWGLKCFPLECSHVSVKSLQLCPILRDPMDCSPPGSSVHRILQAGTLEWLAMPSSKEYSLPRDWTHVFCGSCTAGEYFNCWATREDQESS